MMNDKDIIFYRYFFSIIVVIIVILRGSLYLDTVLNPYPMHMPYWYAEFNNLMTIVKNQRDFYKIYLDSGNLPKLGVFKANPGERITITSRFFIRYNTSPDVEFRHYTCPSSVVSVDFNTRELYVGFCGSYFLKDDLPGKYKRQVNKAIARFRAGHDENMLNENKMFVQNAQGKPYESGDIVLALVGVLSSEDIGIIKSFDL